MRETEWEASAVLDSARAKAVEENLHEYRRIFADIASAIQTHFDLSYQEARYGPGALSQDNLEYMQGLRRKFDERDGDEISQKLDLVREQIENILKPLVR